MTPQIWEMCTGAPEQQRWEVLPGDLVAASAFTNKLPPSKTRDMCGIIRTQCCVNSYDS